MSYPPPPLCPAKRGIPYRPAKRQDLASERRVQAAHYLLLDPGRHPPVESLRNGPRDAGQGVGVAAQRDRVADGVLEPVGLQGGDHGSGDRAPTGHIEAASSPHGRAALGEKQLLQAGHQLQSLVLQHASISADTVTATDDKPPTGA